MRQPKIQALVESLRGSGGGGADPELLQQLTSDPELMSQFQVRVQIIQHARNHSVGKYQSCMFLIYSGSRPYKSKACLVPTLAQTLLLLQVVYGLFPYTP